MGMVQREDEYADVFNAIFSTGPAVALIITLILDNTVPGTREERGLHVWQQLDMKDQDWWDDDYANRVSYPERSAALITIRAWPYLSAPW